MTHVHIMGASCSGKSTYVAALAEWNKQKEADRVIKIEAIDDRAKSLSESWEYLVLQGNMLAPTGFHSEEGNDNYTFIIDVNRKNIFKSNESIGISIVDNPGEIFREIGSSSITGNDLFLSRFYRNIVNNLQSASSLLIMIDCSQPELDREYARKINVLLTDIFDKSFNNKCFNVATVFSKCDRSYMWLDRYKREKVINDYSQTISVINERASVNKFSCKSFIASTFGGLSSDYSIRNSIGDINHNKSFVLRDPSQWKPYGLIAPLYWLSTGKDLKGIDCY